MDFYKQILQDNIESLAEFIERMVIHDGLVDVEKLYVVDLSNGQPSVRKGRPSDKKSNYALSTGGEVVNSFSPLYEIGYFFQCLFLAGIGTAILKKQLLPKYRKLYKAELISHILSDLSSLTETEIYEGMKNPEIAIISIMDTDVVPIRYLKHQLWRLDQSVLTKRVAEISNKQYRNIPPPVINSNYWTEKDQQIAEIAMQFSDSLLHAKIIQYYLVLQIFFEELEIDILNVPIYFNFVPKEELIANGPENSFLDVLIAMHNPEAKVKYKKITGINFPWMLTKACPNCGQGDKRIIYSRIMKDGITVQAKCKPHTYIFRNEHGDELLIKGCGTDFSFKVPTTKEALYEFFKKEDFTLHFAIRELLSLLKDSSSNPMGLVVTDLGVFQDGDGNIQRDQNQVKGYGDNLDMLISSIALQYFFINENIIGDTVRNLKKKDLLVSNPILLFAYDKQTQLVDTEVTTVNRLGNSVPVSDTSALKALERGQSAKDMFKKAINMHIFSLEKLLGLRGKSIGSVEEKLGITTSHFSQKTIQSAKHSK